jgi:hypothetical protein
MTDPTPSSTLTDRYVWAVLRDVPSGDRPELEREIRALIGDAIEAAAANGTLDAEAAERAALTELGSPGGLASRYTGRRNYVIGPNIYPVWQALLRLLLTILIPLIGVLALAASLIEGSTIGQAIVAGIFGAFQVAVQTLFWFTLVFAIIERVAAPTGPIEFGAAGVVVGRGAGVRPWTVDDLPALPDAGRISLGELVASLAANALVLVALVWFQLTSAIVIDGHATPLFDPALWSFWLPWFIVVTILEIVFTTAVYLRGHWTTAYAIGNALLGAAFAIPAIYLLANDLLFNPALVDAAVTAAGGTGAWLQPTKVIVGVSIAVIVGWDGFDGFRKARRSAAAANGARG